MITAADMQRTLLRYMGGAANAESVIDCRMAINDALKIFWGLHEWPYYQGQQVLTMNAPQTTGTVTYDSATRRFTIAGGTWPTWAVYGSIRVGTKDAHVSDLVSSTVIEIEDGSAFTSDISTATAYTLYRNEYPVPNNIRKMAYMFLEQNPYCPLQYLPALEYREKMPGAFGTVPLYYTIRRDRYVLGNLVAVFWPYPSRAYTARFSFIRGPSDIDIWQEKEGLVTVAASATAVTGTNTSFDATHTGCLLRIGRDAVNLPTDRAGQFPAREEMLVKSVSSAVDLVCKPAATYGGTGVTFEISSILDIDENIMTSAFTQQCYYELSKKRKLPDREQAALVSHLKEAVGKAKAASEPNEEITYAGSFSTLRRYGGVWFNIGP